MFSFSGNLFAGQHDTQKSRSPPSKPTPITFPSLQPPEPSPSSPPPAWREHDAGLAAQFVGLKKPTDVTGNTLASLNVTFESECDFETLFFALSNNAQSHLPPKTWLESPTQDDNSKKAASTNLLLSNGRKVPERKDFFIRARELSFSNKDAFSTLSRRSERSQMPLRLAHFRKFWEGLDNVAYYWDTSLDEYCPSDPEATRTNEATASDNMAPSTNNENRGTPDEPESSQFDPLLGPSDGEEPRKKVKTEAVSNKTLIDSIDNNGFSIRSTTAQTASVNTGRGLPARTAPLKALSKMNTHDQSKPYDLQSGSYRGYRIGNGAEMPDQYRIDCVRAFVEPIAWAFGVTLSPHRRPPVLKLSHVRFPVRMSSVAWRGPQDRVKARQGWLEGPVLGVQCRADVNFGKTGNLEAESTLDAVRELGGILLLAQERAREAKSEQCAGEGKWWTTQKRWGGGPGGEVGQGDGLTATLVKASTPRAEGAALERNQDGSRARRRPTPAEIWSILKAGTPLWDPKVVYEAIGRNKNVEWDDVFMVSSLNHHISLLKLRIHPLYLQYMTEGKLPEGVPSDPDWCSPKLQRTRWFDLFNTEDRLEAMRGIWGVLSYLMRASNGDIAMNEA